MKAQSIMKIKIILKNMGRKQPMHLLLPGLLSAFLFLGCAHKSVPPPSQNHQISLAGAEQIPLNPNYKDNSHEDSLNLELDEFDDEFSEDEVQMSDPLISWNRAMFHFNDKLYFWFLKPVATGYKAVVPQPVRIGVRNLFYNLSFPIRFTNCLLQAKFEGAADEFARFIVNTTVGLGGLLDVATKKLDIERYEEDLGQTFGSYGIGPAFYINWPILGPSCLRDTVGLVGDLFLDPVNYMVPRTKYNVLVKSYNAINKTSLTIGDYESLKNAALDPYIAVRDAYFQYRRSKIEK
ncbi:MAG: VacJ family lipoprotein [Deltaproteobacteria bacterium]|nr:VacJ family lipoprotein [Deltaproteobacteria bacterium]